MDHKRNNDGHNPKLLVLIQPNIGLDSDVRSLVVEILNNTLANEAVLILKTRNAYWNVSGPNTYELHLLFDLQYQQLNDITDEIAERVRILGGIAIGSFYEFTQLSRIEEEPGVVPDILRLLADHESCIRFLREDARKCSEEYEDAGTFALLVGLMRMHEKITWMLRAHIQTEPVRGESQKRILKDE
jgi:starvation-inducible DNA-binding protein